MTRYRILLLAAFLVGWIWAAIRPVYPHDWLLENLLVFAFVPLILLGSRYFRLSNVSYTLLTIFMILHVIGSHYTYAEVPFGYVLQEWFGSDRNLYDRLVHFSFGFLMAYPAREIFLRVARVRGFWGFFLPVDITLSLSGLYEIIEWLIAQIVAPEAGLAYLGSQGDVWDAQKDMLLAAAGAVLAMMIIVMINWRLNPDFANELRTSFKIARDDQPLGEVKLREWRNRTKTS